MNLDAHTMEDFSQPLPPDVRAYLNDRGIPDDTIARFGLGWNGECITIPVHDQDGALVLYKLGRAPGEREDAPNRRSARGTFGEISERPWKTSKDALQGRVLKWSSRCQIGLNTRLN